MPRPKEQPNPYDPIELERRVREHDAFVENLFQPIFWNGPEWNLEWLVQDLIPLGYLVMLAGPPKSGKTCLATALALSVANGLPFAGRPVHQGGVLWVSAEESPRERQLLLQTSRLVEPSTPLYTCFKRLPVDEERTLNVLGDWVHRAEARLLVVDPFIACAGHALTDSWAARRSLQELKVFAEIHRVAVLVIHHQKRDTLSYRRSRVADNAQLAATASMNIVLSASPSPFSEARGKGRGGRGVRVPDPSLGFEVRKTEGGAGEGDPLARARQPSPPRLITLDCYGRGEFANRPIYLVSNGPLDYRPTQVEETAPVEESPRLGFTEQAVIQVLEKGPRGSAVIIAETHLNEGTIRNAITNLRRKAVIKMISIGKNQRIYALKKPLPNPFENLNECEPPREHPCEPPRESLPTTQMKKRERKLRTAPSRPRPLR